jgi:hypothetical protein
LIPVDHSTTHTPFDCAGDGASHLNDTHAEIVSLPAQLGTSDYLRSHPKDGVAQQSAANLDGSLVNASLYAHGLHRNGTTSGLAHRFEVPEKVDRQRLVNEFLENCAQWLPVLDNKDLVSLARIGDASYPMLLAQALWYAVSYSCGLPPCATSRFYRQAKALFGSADGDDIFFTIKAALMLTWHEQQSDPSGPMDDSCFWLHTAVTLAHKIGLNRDPASIANSGLLRRLWWTIVVQDSLISVIYYRPRLISLEDSDVRWLTESDFDESPADLGVFSLYLDIVRILGDLAECRRRDHIGRMQKAKFEDRLQLWRFKLAQHENADSTDSADMQDGASVRQLKLLCRMALILMSSLGEESTTRACHRLSAVSLVAAYMIAQGFTAYLVQNRSPPLVALSVVCVYSASLTLLQLQPYGTLWTTIQPKLQALREALTHLSQYHTAVVDLLKALDEKLDRLNRASRSRHVLQPPIIEGELCAKFFDETTLESCTIWRLILEHNRAHAETSNSAVLQTHDSGGPDPTAHLRIPSSTTAYAHLDTWILGES